MGNVSAVWRGLWEEALLVAAAAGGGPIMSGERSGASGWRHDGGASLWSPPINHTEGRDEKKEKRREEKKNVTWSCLKVFLNNLQMKVFFGELLWQLQVWSLSRLIWRFNHYHCHYYNYFIIIIIIKTLLYLSYWHVFKNTFLINFLVFRGIHLLQCFNLIQAYLIKCNFELFLIYPRVSILIHVIFY